MAEHTPGPWDYVPGNEHHGPYVTTDYGSTVCDCYTMTASTSFRCDESRPVSFLHEMAEPNARLIAAAPDMLAALHVLVELCKHATFFSQCSEVELAEAVIAKAEGRS